MDQDLQGAGERARCPENSGRRPLWPGKGEGARPRIPGRQAAGPDLKGQILCLVGPLAWVRPPSPCRWPGPEPKLARISLGGVHDEADIRGHRKTYVGAMPGRIIMPSARLNTKNPPPPAGRDRQTGQRPPGRSAAALLEVLDSEQNSTPSGTISWSSLRPVRCALRDHRQHHLHHPPAPLGPDGGY